MASDDTEAHARVLRAVAAAVSEMALDDTPPSMGQVIHRVVREATGVEDPYRDVKDHFNALALSLYARLKSMVCESDDPFGTAVRLAVAGNIIDFGVRSDIDEESLELSISESLAWPLEDGALDEDRVLLALQRRRDCTGAGAVNFPQARAQGFVLPNAHNQNLSYYVLSICKAGIVPKNVFSGKTKEFKELLA